MIESLPFFDRDSLLLILITLLILIVILGLVFSLMRRARKARWPGGKMGRESFFNLSNLFPALRPTQAQFNAWREECARLTKENEELKSQVQKFLAERNLRNDPHDRNSI